MNPFPWIPSSSGVAFLFPGQGSQMVGMGKDLAERFPAAAETFAEADEILGIPLHRLCFEGPEAELTDTLNAQPALLTAGVAILRTIDQAVGASLASPTAPSYVAGHSMGEYTALVAAGSLSFADGLRLVAERGRLMREAGTSRPGRMAAILGLDPETVAALCAEATANGGIAVVANDNCPGQVVISGDETGMEAAVAALSSVGARKIMPLAVSIAAHSPLMTPAATELQAAIASTELQPPSVPLIANTRAQPLTTVDEIRAELADQLTGSVRWTASMQFALANGVTTFVELGPGDVLSGLIKRIDRTATRRTVNDVESVTEFIAALTTPTP